MADEVTRRDVIAFRLASHHLGERLPEGGLLEAAHGCGVQNSPPGSALLALHARVRGITQAQLATALDADKTLLQTWSLRGAPFAFPTADASVFTAGVMPPTEAGQRLIRGVEPALDAVGMSLREAVDRCGAGIGDGSGRRPPSTTGPRARRSDRPRLPDEQRRRWESPGLRRRPAVGEAIVHSVCASSRCGWCVWRRGPGTRPRSCCREWFGCPIADVTPCRAHRAAPPLPALLRTLHPRPLRSLAGSQRRRRRPMVGSDRGRTDAGRLPRQGLGSHRRPGRAALPADPSGCASPAAARSLHPAARPGHDRGSPQPRGSLEDRRRSGDSPHRRRDRRRVASTQDRREGYCRRPCLRRAAGSHPSAGAGRGRAVGPASRREVRGGGLRRRLIPRSQPPDD